MDRSPYARVRLLFVAGVVVVCAAVWFAAYSQRSAVSRTVAAQRANTQMLVAMLDQETGLRGLGLSGDEEFLEPYYSGRRHYIAALQDAKDQVEGDQRAADALAAAEAASSSWTTAADNVVTRLLTSRRRQLVDVEAMRHRAQAYFETYKAAYSERDYLRRAPDELFPPTFRIVEQ